VPQDRRAGPAWIAKEWRDEPDAPIEAKLDDVLAQLAGVFEELRLRCRTPISDGKRLG
jgi:hypothetical protein